MADHDFTPRHDLTVGHAGSTVCPYCAAPIADWHHMAMWLAWGAGLILHLVLIRVMPAGRGRPRQLITMGAWIGFVSTLVTLFPVIATSTCA